MLVRFRQAALIAALGILMASVVQAQDYQECVRNNFVIGSCNSQCCEKAKSCDSKDCCKTGGCCKEGKCCKAADCCKDGKCCEDKKCDCTSGGDCCCKKGECKCKKSTCAPATKIIVVMPSMPGMEAMGMMPHPVPPPPPMLAPPGLPIPPPPPCYPCCPMAAPSSVCVAPCKEHVDPCASLLSAAFELYAALRSLSAPALCASSMSMMAEPCPATYGQCPNPVPNAMYFAHPPQYLPLLSPYAMPRDWSYQEAAAITPSPGCAGVCPAGTLTTATGEVLPCAAPMATLCTETANSGKIRVNAKPSASQLEMHIGEYTTLQCKKLTVKIADNEIALSRFDDRIRVRGDDLKAMADSVRGEGKNRLILEGDVVLRYKKDGHVANVTGDCVELNLATGAVTIKPGK
jgi:hypothetical protein